MQTINKKQAIAAVLLILIAMSTIAYATLTFGVTVVIEDVNVKLVGVTISPKIPKRTVYQVEYTDGKNGLNITGLSNLAVNDVLRIRVELLVDKALADAVRNIVIVIDTDGISGFGSSDTILTLNNPWREFDYTVTGTEPTGKKNFPVAVLIVTGDKPLTSGSFNVIGSVVGFLPA
ncbi:hypothetical protein KEJ19_03370 [Candidatus Bathyarchaeota archaeon]|nr:hypothetical protein [Candidatus Bathyarchaeota archaeon]